MTTRHLLFISGPGGVSITSALPYVLPVVDHLTVIHWAVAGSTNVKPATSDRVTWINVSDVDQIVPTAEQINSVRPVTGVLAFSEFMVRLQTEIAGSFGLRSHGLRGIENVQDKFMFRQVTAHLDTIRSVLIRSAADLDTAATAVGFPAILKPRTGAGSFGVRYVESIDELKSAYEAVPDAGRQLFSRTERDYVLETFLAGDLHAWGAGKLDSSIVGDYCSVESLVADGTVHNVALVGKGPLQPGFVETCHFWPSVFPNHEIDAIFDVVSNYLCSAGLQNGAVHTELKLCASGPRVLECNPRVGGPTGLLVEHCLTGSFIGDVVKIAFGDEIGGCWNQAQFGVQRYLRTPKTGRLISTPDSEVFKRTFPSLKDLRVRHDIGDCVQNSDNPVLASYIVATTEQASLGALDTEILCALNEQLRFEPCE